jgi:hypothetical protein
MHDAARMKSSRPSILQTLRLLHLAGLMLLLGSVASAPAQTVEERLEKDPGFRIYPVIFGVTATSNSKPPAIRLVEIGTIKGAPKIDNVPDAFIKAAKKKIQAEPPKPKMKDGKPVEIFTFFFYVPGHPNVVVVDLEKPLDKQP